MKMNLERVFMCKHVERCKRSRDEGRDGASREVSDHEETSNRTQKDRDVNLVVQDVLEVAACYALHYGP